MTDQKSGTGRLTPERRRMIEERTAQHRKSGLSEIVSDLEVLMSEIDRYEEALAGRRRDVESLHQNRPFNVKVARAKPRTKGSQGHHERVDDVETKEERRLKLNRMLRRRINVLPSER